MKQNIILDTSFIISQNYLHGSIIKDLINLQKRNVLQIHITDIAFKETFANFRKTIEIEVPRFETEKKKLLKNIRAVKNINQFNNLDSILPKLSPSKLIDEFSIKFTNWIEKNSIIVISSDNLTIKNVVAKYFDSQPPFSSSKKHEFPDAFSIEAIEVFFQEKNEQAILFTSDKDFSNFQSNSITITNEYKKFIDDLNRNKGNLSAINFIEISLEDAKPSLLKELNKKIKDLFTEWVISEDFMVNGEVHSIWYITISKATLSKPEILYIEENNADLSCIYSFLLESFIEYNDYSKAVYDKDDKEFVGITNEKLNFSRQFKLPITLKATFDKDNNSSSFLIDDINYGFPIYQDD